MTVKKSCKYGLHGSFEPLLLLFNVIGISFQDRVQVTEQIQGFVKHILNIVLDFCKLKQITITAGIELFWDGLFWFWHVKMNLRALFPTDLVILSHWRAT